MHDLGVDDHTIKTILRHSDVKTTQGSYIKSLPAQSIDAMKNLNWQQKLRLRGSKRRSTSESWLEKFGNSDARSFYSIRDLGEAYLASRCASFCWSIDITY